MSLKLMVATKRSKSASHFAMMGTAYVSTDSFFQVFCKRFFQGPEGLPEKIYGKIRSQKSWVGKVKSHDFLTSRSYALDKKKTWLPDEKSRNFDFLAMKTKQKHENCKNFPILFLLYLSHFQILMTSLNSAVRMKGNTLI